MSFFEISDRQHLSEDSRFQDYASRNKNIDALYEMMGEAIAEKTIAEWADLNRDRVIEALRDLARFGELHRLGGAVNGTQIVPEAWVHDIRDNGDPDAWDSGTMADLMPGHHYRAMWYTNRSHPHRPVMTMGAFGQSVYADPVAEITIAKLSSFPNDGDAYFGEMARCFDAITQALHGD